MSINHLSFNNIKTNITCCTDQGYIIYSLDPTFEKKVFSGLDGKGGLGLMRMFNRSNIIIMVGGGSIPYKSKHCVILYDQLTNKSIIEIDMKMPVKNVLITKDNLIAVTEKKITLFNWDGRVLENKETYSNDNGLCVMNGNLNMIATLGTNKGEVAIWKYATDSYKTIEAHLTNIETIAVSNSGKFIATASETGTLIRVFNTETSKKEYEFRRGARSANIYDLCFNDTSTLLACCSGNGTVHVFDLYSDLNETKNTQSMLSSFKNYIPGYFGSQWGFKQVTIGNMSKSICCFDAKNNLHIVTYDGSYYRINGTNNEFTEVFDGKLHINSK